MNSVIVALIFGVISYAMIKFEYPTAPLVIAIFLGSVVEASMRQSLILSGGRGMIFLTRPISLVFFILTIFVTFSPFVLQQWRMRRMVAVTQDPGNSPRNAKDKK